MSIYLDFNCVYCYLLLDFTFSCLRQRFNWNRVIACLQVYSWLQCTFFYNSSVLTMVRPLSRGRTCRILIGICILCILCIISTGIIISPYSALPTTQLMIYSTNSERDSMLSVFIGWRQKQRQLRRLRAFRHGEEHSRWVYGRRCGHTRHFLLQIDQTRTSWIYLGRKMANGDSSMCSSQRTR